MKKSVTIEVRDKRIYEFLIAYKRTHDGLSPSYQEIRDNVGLSSTSLVKTSLDRLEEEGLIVLVKDRSSGIKIVNGQWSMRSEDRPGYVGLKRNG